MQRRSYLFARSCIGSLAALVVGMTSTPASASRLSLQMRAPAPEEAPAELGEKEALMAGMMAVTAYEQGDYQQALTMAEIALETLAPAAGWNDEVVQKIAFVMIDSLMKLGRQEEADRRLAEIREHLGGGTQEAPPKASEGETLVMQAVEAFSEGRLDDAHDLGQRGVAMLEEREPEHASLPLYRRVLSSLHVQRMEYSQAESLARRNIAWAEAKGDRKEASSSWTFVGTVELLRGDFEQAEKAYREALRLGSEVSPYGDETQSALAGLGELETRRGNLQGAADLYRQRLAAAEKDIGGVERLTQAYLDLGELYEEMGRFDEALPMLTTALQSAEKQFGADNLVIVRSLTALGRLYRSMGRWDDAIDTWKRTLRLQESKLPPLSPNIGGTLNHYAETLWAANREPELLIGLATRAADLNELFLIKSVAFGSEAQKRAAVSTFESGTDRVITYNVFHRPDHEGATRLGLNTVLRRKGRVLDAVSGSLEAMRANMDDDTRALLDRLQRERGQIAALMLRGPGEGETPDEFRARIAALEGSVKDLERQLGDRESMPADIDMITLERVQERIPDDAVLLEFAVFRRFDPNYERFADAFGARHYVAYVLRRTGAPKMVSLGPADAIDSAVAAFRTALANPRRNDVAALARRLDGLTLAKIRPHLGKEEHLLVSPDGMLNLVPFAALTDERGHWLVRDYEFTYLSSGRDLLRFDRMRPAASGAVIVGSPAFSASPTGTSSHNGRRSADMSSISFPPLPGTKQEAEALGKVLDDARVLIEQEASEAELRNVERPAVLHIATHGFFLADQPQGPEATRGIAYVKSEADWTPPPDADNPLVRSGLALRGANLRADGDDDGILTALEMASLDLWGTKLVVLSACETGLGEVKNGEGVYGLRRALVMAGSESQVMSLWKVDDEATRDLMVAYYKKLKGGEGRSASLREAQLKLLRRKSTEHPYYWASFIPSGRWDEVELEPGVDRPRNQRSSAIAPSGRGSEIREYWRGRKVHDAVLWVGGAYSAPARDQQLDGAAVDEKTGFDLSMDLLVTPRIFPRLAYSRNRWQSPDSPLDLDLAINRLEFDLAVDAIAMPYWWRVRPALLPFAGFGVAFGRNRMTPTEIDPVTMAETQGERTNDLMGGIGVNYGADLALYVRLGKKLSLQLRGGISRPTYLLRAGGERLDYDKEFPRALRWQAGLGIGQAPAR